MEKLTWPSMAVPEKDTPETFAGVVEFQRIAAEINVLRDKLADLQDHCREMARLHPGAADLFGDVRKSLIDVEGENLLVEENREFEAAVDRWEDAA